MWTVMSEHLHSAPAWESLRPSRSFVQVNPKTGPLLYCPFPNWTPALLILKDFELN